MKIVLTGAAGNLGQQLRKPLADRADALISTDIQEIKDLHKNETFIKADLADFKEIEAVIKGADIVVHFGAIVDEAPFETLLGPNFIGAYNVWEAAYKHGAKRVIYASSIHAVGLYPKTEYVGTDVAHRPDTFYGLAKCFTEDLGRMYWEKRGLESVHLRILSCTPAPTNTRALGTWLSFDDLVQLVVRAIDTPVTGFAVVYGVSNNDRTPVNNAGASFLGYRPKDNAEQYADEILTDTPTPDPQDPSQMCLGGPFAGIPLSTGVMDQMGLTAKKT